MSDRALTGYRFRIEGRADTVGTHEFNKELSTGAPRRGRLPRQQFPCRSSRVEAVGMGEDRLLVPTPDQTPEPRIAVCWWSTSGASEPGSAVLQRRRAASRPRRTRPAGQPPVVARGTLQRRRARTPVIARPAKAGEAIPVPRDALDALRRDCARAPGLRPLQKSHMCGTESQAPSGEDLFDDPSCRGAWSSAPAADDPGEM